MLHPILSIIILFEVIATLLIVIGFVHEEKIVQIEDRIISHLKKAIKNIIIEKK